MFEFILSIISQSLFLALSIPLAKRATILEKKKNKKEIICFIFNKQFMNFGYFTGIEYPIFHFCAGLFEIINFI